MIHITDFSKKNKINVINYYKFLKLVEERNTYFENLPDNSIANQSYLNNLELQISKLYISFGSNQELFWQEYETVADVAILQTGYRSSSNNLVNTFRTCVEIFINFLLRYSRQSADISNTKWWIIWFK